MKKEEIIAKYGEDAYKKRLEQNRAWAEVHREEKRKTNRKYYEVNREKVAATQKKYRKKHLEEVKAYNKKWRDEHPEQTTGYNKKYRDAHPEKMIVDSQEGCRKGGKYYERNLQYKQSGVQGEKNKIRNNHARQYRPYKDIIAPDSQIHHEWIPETSDYSGVALVEANAHQYGIVDVIQILDGKITLLTEEEVREGKGIET